MSKKLTKNIVIALTIVSLLLFSGCGSASKADSIELSIPFDRTEYDINAEIPVTISVSPDGSSIDNLEYFTDSSAVSFADSIIKTGEIEGDYSFYVRSGDVESNILSIHVVDISARNEATAKAEAERLAKEAEEKKVAEEQAAREAEEKAAAEQAAKEAEEQRIAEEQAAKEAREEASAKQTSRETVTDLPESEPTPEPQPAEEPVQIVEEQIQEVPVDGTAYLSATGKKYHSIDHCGKMNPDKAQKTTISKAEASGYERCSKCW